MTASIRTWHKTALAICIILATGCATLMSDLEPPRVSLASIRVQEVRGFETAFEVDLRVMNRNDVPLVIQGLDCELKLGGRQLAEGVAGAETQIAPYESGIVTVTVYSSMLDMVGVARRLLKGVDANTGDEKITYEIAGHLTAAANGASGRFPFNSNGEIDLSEMTGR